MSMTKRCMEKVLAGQRENDDLLYREWRRQMEMIAIPEVVDEQEIEKRKKANDKTELSFD